VLIQSGSVRSVRGLACAFSYGLNVLDIKRVIYFLATSVRINFIPMYIILPVVLYGCETWSLTLREEHRLRMFNNRVLTRTFGPKRDEVKGDGRKSYNEELHNL
jgi:hypothetical protein